MLSKANVFLVPQSLKPGYIVEKQKLSKIMEKAQAMCRQTGGRLTEKRKRILELLILSDIPLSAYEVSDAYNKQSNNSMPTMSVYRILDFLEAELLVHKLSSTSKYVACSHIACDHSHEVSQFLICNKCQRVKEIGVNKRIIDELDKHVSNSGYKLMNSQLELDCLCDVCAA